MPTRDEYDIAETNWSSMSVQEKLDFVTRVVRDTLERYGYKPVPVIVANMPGAYGRYLPGVSPFIAIDRDHLRSDPFADVIDTALHETAHAMQDQDWAAGGGRGPSSEDVDAFERDAENFAGAGVGGLRSSGSGWDDHGGGDDDDWGSDAQEAGDDLSSEEGGSSSDNDTDFGSPTTITTTIEIGGGGYN